MSVEDSFPPPQAPTHDTPPSPEVEIVEDSFLSSPSHSNLPVAPIELSKDSSAPFNDALSEAIQQMKAVAHLPLDEEEGSE
jgi:DNA polymerase IV